MTTASARPEEADAGPLPPVRAAVGGQTWREVAHLLLNLPLAIVGFVLVVVGVYAGLLLSVTVVGFPLLAVGLLGSRRLGALERRRARRLLRVRVDPPSRLRARGHGLLPWLWAQLRDPVSWRHSLYLFVRLPWGVLTFAVTLVSLFVAWPVLPWVTRGLSNVDRVLVRALLSSSDGLERRIAQLEEGRGKVVVTAAADLRRIERDLHDGAQARLVALAMDLGMAKEKLARDPEGAASLVDGAHAEAKRALRELRDLARGIHPAILTDRGLGPALTALAGRCTVPVDLTDDLPGRPDPAVEAIAYYTAAELLTNVGKHSGARQAALGLREAGGRLVLCVSDDGRGGADARHGTGLAGLAERVTAVDGELSVDSPAGGPTVVTVRLPWRV